MWAELELEMLRWFFKKKQKKIVFLYREESGTIPESNPPYWWEASSPTLEGGERILSCDKMECACRKILIQPLKKTNLGVAGALFDPKKYHLERKGQGFLLFFECNHKRYLDG